ncbi:DNA-processing protein DprA [Rhodocaloribacter litoris]|uniref:DNA-processing protein DprA n=1 Tax=Rhodocaloribacter litoris TaxID=2558931 RepID=UPI0014212859|nr:DNA-processing protein DprA [Rhodocaloribacter litoris]QXD16102.1 DNA-processing protein DprA [Rhodocaloribacter litoris]GIV59836.1 MAG: DNA processing protein DprA [Rhodothermaceae bacterium]
MGPSLFAEAGFDERQEKEALVALSMAPGVGPGRIRSLVARFGSAAAALQAPARVLATVPGIGPQTAAAVAAFDGHAAVTEQFERAERVDATLVTAWDPAFPPLLREIYDPPAFLWVRGTLAEADAKAIAIVGTRRATAYGKQVAYDFAAGLARHGFTVVSGLAYGIDAAAHRGALEAGGRTLAVLGSGVDRIYPARHARLAQAIIEQGALLSEYALGAAPDAPNFPRRNRLISGLTRGTLVVEAFETGGALITARLALEQNREVFAVPSPVHSRAGVGSNRLIQQGYARLVLSVEDMLAELGLILDEPPDEPAPVPPPALDPLERRLYDALDDTTPVHIDTLCTRTGLDPSTALVYLLNLEFKGLVRQMAGKQFFRA